MNFEISAITNVGLRRDHNEDDYIICPDIDSNQWTKSPPTGKQALNNAILLVADGMGGTNAGEVASDMACTYFMENTRQLYDSNPNFDDLFENAIIECSDKIYLRSEAESDKRNMGSTIVLAALTPGKVFVSWLGDSRAYLYRKGTLTPLTKDHSEAQELIDQGVLTEETAFTYFRKNYISQSLGQKDRPKPGHSESDLAEGDIVLLCTDGLCGLVRKPEMLSSFNASSDLNNIGDSLLKKALDAGGDDNITIILCRYGEAIEPMMPSAEDRFESSASGKRDDNATKIRIGEARSQNQPRSKKKSLIISIAVLLPILIIVGLVSVLFEHKHHHDQSDATATKKQADSIHKAEEAKKSKDSLNAINTAQAQGNNNKSEAKTVNATAPPNDKGNGSNHKTNDKQKGLSNPPHPVKRPDAHDNGSKTKLDTTQKVAPAIEKGIKPQDPDDKPNFQ